MNRKDFLSTKKKQKIRYNQSEVRILFKKDAPFYSLRKVSNGNGNMIAKIITPIRHLGLIAKERKGVITVINAGNETRIPLTIVDTIEKIPYP